MSGVAKLTPLTHQALRKVTHLLDENFDAEKGAYRSDWDDARIAKETGISEAAVKDYRVGAFGKIKPPSELTKLRQDLSDLETAFLKMDGEIREGIKDAKVRIANLQRRFD